MEFQMSRETFIDRLKLFGAAFVLILVVGTAFLLADLGHVNPTRIFIGFIVIGFFPAVGWDYRDRFRSTTFVIFFVAWALIHGAVFWVVMTHYGWEHWLVAVFIELCLFYATLRGLFGIKPPGSGPSSSS
jgi:hypothetical protein